ncbi:MAG: nitrite reductase [Dehalococcoidia bacterium]|nr:MAG: nitrite reductase [Dehalococcoidia bacterium]
MDSGYKMMAAFGSILGVGALLIASVALVKDGGGGGSPSAETKTVAATPAPTTKAIDVELGDLFIKPKSVEVASNTTLEVTVKNTGQIPHNLKLGTTGTKLLNPGDTEKVKFGPLTKDVQLLCDVPGHAAAGMTMDVKVAAGSEHSTAAPATTVAAGPGAKIDAAATPGPNWKRREPIMPSTPSATTHRIALEANETVVEVAPGVTQEMWTFNGQAPGPVLRGKVGDTFEFTLTNKGKLGHSIDFHASKVAWNVEMRTLKPGESLVYKFEAKHSGIFMYHCGTAPALHHIGNGMFGAIIIDPPGLPAVEKEFIFVQSEIYTGPLGQPGDLTKMTNEAWDAVVFNGYFNQYLHSPIRIEPNKRYRAWVLDAGPSENSSFHVVGTIFDTMYKEGAYSLRPSDAKGGAQALDLQPAQGGFVEFSMDAVGLYPIVTHKFANVGKGALGLFQAGDVPGTSGAAH